MDQQTILIIEDNQNNLMVMRDLLHLNGYKTLEAQDGPEGMRVTQEQQPDLVLMDIQLPTMDGYEATRQLKADERTKHIPVIAVTSFALSGEEAKARAAGCDAYLSKPIDIHHTVGVIQEVLSREQA
jgi:two-component system, cell cycle response regulator DivK